MNRKLRPTRSTQQIKEEQINFLLEDIEKKLEEHKKAIEIKDKQLFDTKKMLQGAKKRFDSVVKENNELKKYIEKIKQRYNSTRNNNRNILTGKKNTLGKNYQKTIKKLCLKRRLTMNLK